MNEKFVTLQCSVRHDQAELSIAEFSRHLLITTNFHDTGICELVLSLLCTVCACVLIMKHSLPKPNTKHGTSGNV